MEGGWRWFPKFLFVFPHRDSFYFTGRGNNTEVLPTVKSVYSSFIRRNQENDHWVNLRTYCELGLSLASGTLILTGAKVILWVSCINSDPVSNSPQGFWVIFFFFS